MHSWISLRRATPQRSFTVLLLTTLLALSLRALVPRLDLNLETKLARPLVKHTLTPDGRLIVQPSAPHPIFQLIRDAEAAWETKRAQASQTLEEAVAEYRRRYRRAPPLGFDKWCVHMVCDHTYSRICRWEYVVKHGVQLPDEYDEIFEDLEPFWGIDPHELEHTQQELEARDGLVTVQKTDAHARFEVVRSTLPQEREHLKTTINNILALVREVEHELPPIRITFSPFDNPSMLSDWHIKTMALEAAANGTSTSTPCRFECV